MLRMCVLTVLTVLTVSDRAISGRVRFVGKKLSTRSSLWAQRFQLRCAPPVDLWRRCTP